MHDSAIQGVDDTQPLLDRPGQILSSDVLNSPRIGLELELVDHMAEVVVVLVLEVGHEVLDVHIVRLE